MKMSRFGTLFCLATGVPDTMHYNSGQHRISSSMTRTIVISLLLLAVAGVAGSSKAAGFESAGELRFFNGTNAPVKSKFRVQVNSCSWSIQVSEDPYYPFLEESTIACDGTNLFQVDVFKSKPDPFPTNKTDPASSGGGSPGGQQVNWIATVKTGNVPDYDSHHNSALWLAFAAGCQLNQTAANQLPCEILHPRNKPGCSVKAAWELHGTDPAVLLAATIFDEGKVEMLDGKFINRPKPFESGFTNLVYSVSAFTNIGTAKVPLQFRLELFAPRLDAHSSSDIATVWHLDGFVESAAPLTLSNPAPPQIRERTRVEDFRASEISSVKSVIYYTTNGWLTTNHPAFKGLIAGVPYTPPRQSSVTRYVVATLLFGSLIFLVILWKQQKSGAS